MPRFSPEEDLEWMRQKLNMLNEDILPSQRIAPEVLLQKLEAEPLQPFGRRTFVYKRLALALCAVFVCCIVLVYTSLNPIGVNQTKTAAESVQSTDMMGIVPEQAAAPQEGSAASADNGASPAANDDGYAAVREALKDEQPLYTQEQLQPSVDGVPETSGGVERFAGIGGGGSGGGGFSINELKSSTVANTMDDADIIKTDGGYIYYAAGTQVKIAELLPDGKMALTATIDVSKQDRYIRELFLGGDTLTLLCNNYAFTTAGKQSDTGTAPLQTVGTTVEMYDITDRTNPVKTREFTQEGEYLSSKVSGDVLYMVSVRKTFEYTGLQPVDAIVPSVYDSTKGTGGAVAIAPQEIILPALKADSSYATITALKLYDATAPADTKAVLGGAQSVYCAPGSVYVLNTVTLSGQQAGTQITKLAYSGTSFTGVTEGKVEGRMPEGPALDETNGNLRMVTTTLNSQGKNTVNLFVLKSDLSVAGSLTGITEDQAVYAARYYEDTAYVSAFGEQDPLLVFSLADPAAPKLIGDVKVKGFSSGLHPVGEHLVAGLGYLTGQKDGDTVRKGVQFTLFDVSDKQNPAVLTAVTLGESGSYSEAITSYKAFYYISEKNVIGFPVTLTRYKDGGGTLEKAFGGYYLYSVQGDALKLLGKVASASDAPEDEIRRGICVGNYLYTASANTLTSRDLTSFAVLGTLEWK